MSINNKDAQINSQMEATNKKVMEMTRKEFWMKVWIFIAIVLLLAADVGVAINKFLG